MISYRFLKSSALVVMVVCSCVMAGDSLQALFENAAAAYDVPALEQLYEKVVSRDTTRVLLSGMIAWRLELVAFCENDKKKVKKYGREALRFLEMAEKKDDATYLAVAHQALASQLLSTLGVAGAIKYGPQSVSALKTLRTIKPDGYFTLLVEALNFNRAPSFAGGDPEKGVVLLEKMEKAYPDSVDVAIHLADVYHKTGRVEEALRKIKHIAAAHPENMLARKVAAEMGTK